jgi:hypothetical protein
MREVASLGRRDLQRRWLNRHPEFAGEHPSEERESE